MSVILNYLKWKKLYEQATAGSGAIDFVIAAGASAKPMRDKTLNTNQKYPLPTDAPNSNHIYELTLAKALRGDFSTAKIVGPVQAGEDDQITFDNNTIKGSGKIVIEWNPSNFSKLIQVSGNGALVLARAADSANRITNRGSLNGVIVLELAATALYSKLWSIVNSGLSSSQLRASLNGRLIQVTVQTASADLKPTLVEKWQNSIAWVETQYSPAIIEQVTEGGTVKQKSNYPPLAINTSIQPYYGKYALTDFTKGAAPKTLAPIVKKNMVDVGMDALAAYTDTYFAERLTGLDKEYVTRMASRAKENIASVKNEYSVNKIADKIASAAVSFPDGSVAMPASKTNINSSSYEEGQSK